MKKYRPANGTEGMDFFEAWCFRCSKDNYPDQPLCQIIADTMLYELDDRKYPDAWQIDENGVPFCTEADLCD